MKLECYDDGCCVGRSQWVSGFSTRSPLVEALMFVFGGTRSIGKVSAEQKTIDGMWRANKGEFHSIVWKLVWTLFCLMSFPCGERTSGFRSPFAMVRALMSMFGCLVVQSHTKLRGWGRKQADGSEGGTRERALSDGVEAVALLWHLALLSVATSGFAVFAHASPQLGF